jgi:predicted P-loop ATPase
MKEIKKLPVWLLWKKETRNGLPTKVPYKAPGQYASSTDPATWDTYDNLVQKYYKTNKFSGERGIGIVFENTANVIGVDFDKCIVDGILDAAVERFVVEAKTYTEYSPSGTGLHLLFQKTEDIELLANKHHFDDFSIEIYTTGRYFTFTENEHPLSKPLRKVDSSDFTKLLETLEYPWKKVEKPQVSQTVVTHSLEDSILLDKMFGSKNGAKIKRLWEGDVTEHNNDYSSADHSLCMHLAFWSGKNQTQIERLWLSSPLGQREKTQSRQDYRLRTVLSAISVTSEVYTPPVAHVVNTEDKTDYDFILGGGSDKKDPYPLLIFPNIIRVLRHCDNFRGKIRKNDFSHFVEVKTKQGQWESLNDDFISETREYIAENFPAFIRLNKDMTTDAIIRVAMDNCVNPPRDYFTSLVWDKTPRLNSWIHYAYGTPDDDLHQAIGSNWLKGLVKRVMQPGCQFDEVLALESPQGFRKSTSLRVLGAPWHVETTHSLDNKDFYLLLAQNVIVEFSEGEIMDRASVNKLKAEITKTEDQLRPPYERGMVKFKRSCVFAVTTNRLELKDDTGNRRWLPVQLQKIADIDWLAENKDQLFAEAYHRVIVAGETTHEYPDTLRELQESRREYDEGEEKLLDAIAELEKDYLVDNGVTLEFACAAIHGKDYRVNKLDELRISSMLRRIGFVNERKYVGGKRVRRWFPSEKTTGALEIIKQHNHEF